MLTLELDDETAGLLAKLAARDHQDAGQLIKQALADYLAKSAESASESVLMADIIATLPPLPSFTGNPLDVQKAMRDEWD
ncbi:ribbon-helix-helix protein, CopG family [Methylomonas sp. BW4-1]|uniref:Ribbon-helix-helix protein, CopG family n=1 Tax=Methylomonas defluvii TaxID=3045149 RepID=A0ABU4UF25_9GAMM|nr:ribbon-helix-helix protein, CopG family [Methylomonas sp. OY6]MDX8127738.1 ribbon-helix-helix protein, CopG family [Methylomonas sp. OY6]